MYRGFQANCLFFCAILTKPKSPRESIEKGSNLQFHENPSNGSHVVPRAKTKVLKDW
jgi:hypothetical protein